MRSIFLGILFISTNMLANDQKSHTSLLANVYPLADGSVILVPKDAVSNCQNNYLMLSENHNSLTKEGLKNMVAVALAAGSTGKTLMIKYVESGDNCYINRLSVRF